MPVRRPVPAVAGLVVGTALLLLIAGSAGERWPASPTQLATLAGESACQRDAFRSLLARQVAVSRSELVFAAHECTHVQVKAEFGDLLQPSADLLRAQERAVGAIH